MAVALRGAVQSVAHTAGGTIAVTKPAGVVSGDIIFAKCVSYGTITQASGFTVINTDADNNTCVYVNSYRVAGGSEPSTYDFSSTDSRTNVKLWAVSGGDVATPYEGNTSTDDPTNDVTQTAPDVTPSVTGCWRVITWHDTNNGTNTIGTPPPSMTALGTVPLVNTGHYTTADYFEAVGTGALGTKALVWGTQARGGIIQFLIRPEPVISTPPRKYGINDRGVGVIPFIAPTTIVHRL